MSRELVERARRGEHDAFAVLAGAAISRLDAAAWLMLRDTDLAMDAVQNALVRAWRDLPTLRDPDRFDAWLYRLLINACTDEIRRAKRHRLDVDIGDLTTEPATADATSMVVDRDELERGFHRLGPGGAGGPRPASTTSTCRCPRSPRPSGSRWARSSPVSIAACGRCARCSTPTHAPGHRYLKDARHDRERRSRPRRLRLAARVRRAPRAGPSRCRPADDEHAAPAPGLVEPRKVAPHADDTSLRIRPQARVAAPHRPRPGRGDRDRDRRDRFEDPAGPAVRPRRQRRRSCTRKDGDIYRYDPATKASTPLVTGPGERRRRLLLPRWHAAAARPRLSAGR